MKKQILFLLFCSAAITTFCQRVETMKDIFFKNSSFEDNPGASVAPKEWKSVGSFGMSEPDTQPGAFDCEKPAYHGKTYLGMVVRDNGTKEAVCQKLSDILGAGKSYGFGIWLAKSDTYISRSYTTGMIANYNEPCVLRIWAIDKKHDKIEELGNTKLVSHTDWQLYEFTFTPKQPCARIMLEVDFKDRKNFYNGNILVDDISEIYYLGTD